MRPPTFEIGPAAFRADPYPDLARMQATAPLVHVPQLCATLLTRRDDIFREEKRIETFSSVQPDGLMTRLMGQNMMRKDGEAHRAEREMLFPALSPRTVRDSWTAAFRDAALGVLEGLKPRGECDLVADYALPVSGAALCAITGLRDLGPRGMDRVSQAMIDGCANYAGDAGVEARCHAATREIDDHITAGLAAELAAEDLSLLAVAKRAGMAEAATRANIKLAISGGQNEPRDAIAGAAWAVLSHPGTLEALREGQFGWREVFEEYARWISPIGMSPRRIARDDTVAGYDLREGDMAFLMFGAGNRDADVFDAPDEFRPARDTSKALSFGAGPHFCAGAAAARALVADVALPLLFEHLPNLRLTPGGQVRFDGWAFRGPLAVPVTWG